MPDWRKSADYAFTSKLDLAGWAWEFMRRNRDYHLDFERFRAAVDGLSKESFLHRGEDAYALEDAHRLGTQLGAKWGQGGPIADPARDLPPSFLHVFPLEPDGWQIDAWFQEAGPHGPPMQIARYATLTFDLTRPLKPQLARARHRLSLRQSDFPPEKKPKGKTYWPTYLRLLDAVAAEADTPQIISGIEAYRHLDNTAATGYRANDRVSDHKKAALKLLANPLSLLS